MAKFTIHAGLFGEKQLHKFSYDSETSELLWPNGKPVEVHFNQKIDWTNAQPVPAVTPENPTIGKTNLKTVKISMGLKCNYSCQYCSQGGITRAEETNASDVDEFVRKMPKWFTDEDGAGRRIEFWGGEPFVYWKTMKPLAERLRTLYPKAQFSVITNGSLLDEEKVDWLDRMGFAVGVSHDGPGQKYRGEDPFDNPEQRKWILELYRRLTRRRMSFNSVLHKGNPSRDDIVMFFEYVTGDDNPQLGEGELAITFHGGGQPLTFSPEEHIEWRVKMLNEIRGGTKASKVYAVHRRITEMLASVANRRPLHTVGQKCSMDRTDTVTVDLLGNVFSCQNASPEAIALNGNPHLLGTVDKIDEVALTTATHHRHREECPKCPVVHICKGNCMTLDGDLWEASCDTAFSDCIVDFAVAFEMMTGMIPVYIEGPQRRDRWDIFGALGEKVKPPKQKRFIPIKAAF